MSVVAYLGVVGGPDGVAVDRDGALPRFEVAADDAGFWQDVGPATQRFGDLLGAEVTVLRHLAVRQTSGGSIRVLHLEPHRSLDWPTAEPGEVAWSLPEPLSALLARPAATPPAHRVPWFEPGWWHEAVAWIQAAVPGVERVRQVRTWNLSTVVAVETSDGTGFFKAESPALPGEVALTGAISDLFPRVVAPLLARNDDRRWMVLGDVGHRRLDDSSDPEVWVRAGRCLAEIQIESRSVTNQLEAAGCPVRSAGVLVDDAVAMLEDERWLTAGEHGLDHHELAAVGARADRWVRALEDLTELDVPLTLEHGDFHPGQVMLGDSGDPRLLDWSDASVTIPLIALEIFLQSVNEFTGRRPDDEPPAPAAAFRDAYLDRWREAMDPAVTDAARRLVSSAWPLLYGLPYWRLVQRMEQPWEMWDVLPHTLRRALNPPASSSR